MSDGEAKRINGPARRMPFGRVFHPFLELPYDIAAEVVGVQDEPGCSLDQARVGRWFLGSMMMVVACLSPTAGCAAYGQTVNVISTRESPELARFDRLQP
jgi:hypothetical protein